MDNPNVKIFYKVQFDVEEKESSKDRDLLWDIVCHVRRWLERVSLRCQVQMNGN